MTLFELLLFLLIAALSGSVGRALGGGSRGGCLTSLAVGFIGALLGGKLSQLVNLPEPFVLELGGKQLPLVWSVIGGALFVAALNLLVGRRR